MRKRASGDGVLTALPGAECDRVGTGPKIQLHRDADDNVATSSAGLVNRDCGTAVDAAKRQCDQHPEMTRAWCGEHNPYLTVVVLQLESPFAKYRATH